MSKLFFPHLIYIFIAVILLLSFFCSFLLSSLFYDAPFSTQQTSTLLLSSSDKARKCTLNIDIKKNKKHSTNPWHGPGYNRLKYAHSSQFCYSLVGRALCNHCLPDAVLIGFYFVQDFLKPWTIMKSTQQQQQQQTQYAF